MFGTPRSATLVGWTLVALVSGCSLVNAPDDVQPGGEGGGSTTATTTTGGSGQGGDTPAECAVPTDCPEAPECSRADCQFGSCVVLPMPAGTSCGAVTGECDLPDACDGAGTCVDAVAADGTLCSDCEAGGGACSTCSAGICQDCGGERATHKTFRAPGATQGWTFDGGWGLYQGAPPSPDRGTVPFARPVLGTDGNRARPYPGNELEFSAATSPPTTIPATIEFLSWHRDEGSFFDKKAVRISVDGGSTYETIAVCPDDGGIPFAFCQSRSDLRAFDDWDLISIPVPSDLVGQVGIVQFRHDTRDNCCGFEQGWFVDMLNFATTCACSDASDCGHLDGTCAAATCDGAIDECSITPQAPGAACGDAPATECSVTDKCDSYGFCNGDDAPLEGLSCETCPSGPGQCLGCLGGVCTDCPAEQDFFAFFDGIPPGWEIEGKWAVSNCLPVNSNGGAACSNLGATDPKGPFFQNPGSRQLGGFASDIETASFRTPPTVLGDTLSFRSWSQDRGGEGLQEQDNKRVRVSLDGGANWTTLADCTGNAALSGFPFCDPWPTPGNDRSIADWDDIEIPLGPLAGQVAIVEFFYDTVDGGQGWERGWMIDDLNAARCGSY